MQGGTSYPAVRDGDIREQPILLPTLPEQERIVTEIERRLSVASEVEMVLEMELVRAARLRQSILKQTFEGKLIVGDRRGHVL